MQPKNSQGIRAMRVSMICRVIDRDVQQSTQDLTGYDEPALRTFINRLTELGAVDVVELALNFDGSQTVLEINIGTMPPVTSALKQ